MEKHKKRVEMLSDQVADFYNQKKPFRIYHGSTNSTRVQVFKQNEMVDASDMNHVLRIDTSSNTALIEPNVPMDALVKATLRHGLVPPVVMEFPGITAGGGVQGAAGESSSFKYGGFHNICSYYEIITSNGEVVQCSPAEHPDLFYGSAGSYGTLGVMTKLAVRLIPAKRYVTLTYLPVSSFKDAVETLEAASKQDYDYIDGIMFGHDHGVIMVGRLSDEKHGKVQRFRRARDEWFYLHAEEIDATAQEHTESIPLQDYLFRYDRGGFWVGKHAFTFLGVSFNKISRFLLNRMLHTRPLYEALQASGISQQFIVQDLAFPLEKVEAFLQYTDRELGIYPLWLCPLRTDHQSQFMPSHLNTPLAINVGLWGGHTPSYDEFVERNKAIEQEVRALGGKKWFYAHSYYDKKTFWTIYDEQAYEKLREKYHTEYLPTIFDKVRVKERHAINIKSGVWRPFFGISKLRVTK